MNKFEIGDMDWLKGILNGQVDNMLSHGRTERIVNHIEELESQLEERKTWGDLYLKYAKKVVELEAQLAEAKEFSERCALTPIGEAMKQLAASREFALSLWTDENELFEQAYREKCDGN